MINSPSCVASKEVLIIVGKAHARDPLTEYVNDEAKSTPHVPTELKDSNFVVEIATDIEILLPLLVEINERLSEDVIQLIVNLLIPKQ